VAVAGGNVEEVEGSRNRPNGQEASYEGKEKKGEGGEKTT